MVNYIPRQPQGSWPNVFLTGFGQSNAQADPDQPVKRGRGRPRKNPIPSETTAGQAANPPRKRGRPPKNAAAQAIIASGAVGGDVSDGIVTPPLNELTPVKRKPGRPRKLQEPNQQQNPAEGVVKRGPGRPRKSDVKPAIAHPTPVAQSSVANPFNHNEQAHTAASLQQLTSDRPQQNMFLVTDSAQPNEGESSRAVQTALASAATASDTPKRGRGRPKGSKNIRRALEKAGAAAEAVGAAGHGSGNNPVASVNGDPSAATPVKRGRGRPRKNQTAPQLTPQTNPSHQEHTFTTSFSSPNTSQMSSLKRPWNDSVDAGNESSQRMTWVEIPGNTAWPGTPSFSSTVKDEQQQMIQETLPPDGESKPVKRPRGRPRKHPLPTPSGDPATAPVKRGRGRPRKEERR